MERFKKINWPRPTVVPNIFSLPELQNIWGSEFRAQAVDAPMRWVHNNDAAFGFVTSGKLIVRSEFGSLLKFSGSSIFIPPEVPHLCQILDPNTSGWFVTIPKNRCADLPREITELAHSKLLIALGEKISFTSRTFFSTPESKRLTEVFYDELQVAPPTKVISTPIPHQEVLKEIAQLIIGNPSDMKNIDSWAKYAGMSRRVFTRTFLNETGLSFAAWRRRVKIADAIRCLRLGHPVSEISFQLGYQNPSTFNAVFKKQFGVSPSEYIKNHQANLIPKKVAL